MVANTPMDTDKIKIYGSRVRVDSMDKVAEIEAAEKAKMKEKVDKIKAFDHHLLQWRTAELLKIHGYIFEMLTTG